MSVRLNTRVVLFYDLYPSEDRARKEKRGKKGLLDDLLPVFDARFDPNSSIVPSV